jgi:hypothetical protein
MHARRGRFATGWCVIDTCLPRHLQISIFHQWKTVSTPVHFWVMHSFGESLVISEKSCYTFPMKFEEKLQGNANNTFTPAA